MSVMKVYNGTSWSTPFYRYPKIYNGTDWVYARPTVWNSTTGAWSVLSSSDSSTVTVGYNAQYIAYVGTYYYYGYSSSSVSVYGFGGTPFGSITNPDVSIADESTVYEVYWYEAIPYYSGSSVYYISLNLKSREDLSIIYDNAGWTTMTIGSYSYNRADATFASSAGSASWGWTTTSTNPFGTTVGATKTVSWA